MAVVKQLWAQIGVNVTIQSMETNALFTKYMNGDYEASDPLPSITADVLVPDELALAWLDPKGVQKGFWSFYKSQEAWELHARGELDDGRGEAQAGLRPDAERHARRRAVGAAVLRARAHRARRRRSRTSTRSRAAGGTSGRSGRAEHDVRGPTTVAAAPRRARTDDGVPPAAGAARRARALDRHARRVPADPPRPGRPGADHAGRARAAGRGRARAPPARARPTRLLQQFGSFLARAPARRPRDVDQPATAGARRSSARASGRASSCSSTAR